MPDPDLQTILEDVKTIKSILQNEDAPFPRVWWLTWLGASAITIVGLVQYFVPFFRNLDFDGKALWLWLPAFCLMFPLLITLLFRDLERTGKKFLSQGRFRHILFARFIIPPAALVIVWVSSRNPVFPVEGVCLLVIAIWQTAIEQALPTDFRSMPLIFLTLGLVELGMKWSGPEVTLANVLLAAFAVAYAGFLFRVQADRKNKGRQGG